MRPAVGTIFLATIYLVGGVAAAAAQMSMPGLPIQQDRPKPTPEEAAKAEKLERAYRAATQATPDQKASSDPWGGVRSAPSAKSGGEKTGRPSSTR